MPITCLDHITVVHARGIVFMTAACLLFLALDEGDIQILKTYVSVIMYCGCGGKYQ